MSRADILFNHRWIEEVISFGVCHIIIIIWMNIHYSYSEFISHFPSLDRNGIAMNIVNKESIHRSIEKIAILLQATI